MKNWVFIVLIISVVTGCSPKLSPDYNWGRQRWVLTQMKEIPVQLSGGRRDAQVEFLTTEKRFTGNGGCNQITGTYALEKKDRIKFSEITATKMMCPDIDFENTFLSLLNKVDRFRVDGDNMILKDGRETILVFQRRN